MARCDLLKQLKTKDMTPSEFSFERQTCIPMAYIIPPNAVEELHRIATSVKLSSKIDDKYQMIDNIMTRYNMRKFHAGTNRVVYKHLEIPEIVVKVAVDSVGMQDNPKEFINQQYLKPFVTKVFEVSPCGTVAIVERVQPITSVSEFKSLASSIFNLLSQYIIGEYVLEDIGTKFFRNYGIRDGFGPVLLDYPYMFKLDGNKLYCNKEMNPITHEECCGQIDYDDGFNHLYCMKCGKIYQARDLETYIKDKKIIIESEDIDMKVRIKQGNSVIYESGEVNETRTLRRNIINHGKTATKKADKVSGSDNPFIGRVKIKKGNDIISNGVRKNCIDNNYSRKKPTSTKGNNNDKFDINTLFQKSSAMPVGHVVKSSDEFENINNVEESVINKNEEKDVKFDVESKFIKNDIENKKDNVSENDKSKEMEYALLDADSIANLAENMSLSDEEETDYTNYNPEEDTTNTVEPYEEDTSIQDIETKEPIKKRHSTIDIELMRNNF